MIYKEIRRMSYDEKVQQLLETAADYTAVTASFNLESTLHAQVCKSSIDTVKQAIEGLSIGTIHFTVNEKNCLTACVDELNVMKESSYSIFHIFAKNDEPATELLKNTIDQMLVGVLSFSASLRICNVESIAKYIGYARFILLSIDDTVAETIKRAVDTYKKADEDYQEKYIAYSGYVGKVSLALRFVSHAWFREKAVFVPGMKVGVNDLRTYKTSIKTIKRCDITDDHYSITFKESATIVTDPKRINEELTWYLNTKEHSDIAKAIKWKPIAEFI